MKKLILTLSVLTLAFSAFAQNISGGLKAGLNFANQDISSSGISLDTKSKLGFQAGAFLTVMFNEKMGLQPEILYSMQGSELDIDGSDGTFNFNYLNIPVLFRYNITDMINLHAGPQIGMLLSAELESDGDTEDVKDSFKGSDFGLAVGGGVDLPMGLGFGARYTFGLSKIADDPDFWDGDWSNSAFQLYASYKLFGKK